MSKREYPSVLKEASHILERSFGCKVIHRGNQSHVIRMNAVEDSFSEDLMVRLALFFGALLGYISFAKSSDRFETQVFTFDWGVRATMLCEPMELLESYCSIINDPHVDKWEDQLVTVKALEVERQQILEASEKYIEGV
ncbi:unnamed protein product [Heligmosomoides polygyrus]|uniref:Uncharacterized protein n=1 Tax=Heligmosomoides polygyrus TaxID=6339 RepID=A0A3P8DUN7_HELPZ|nr:unnamed protein product [Heligmosomoides polygyrus]